MTASTTITLRPVTEADREFLLSLYGSTRTAELDQVAWPPGGREAFVGMQFDLQEGSYRGRHPRASFDVVELDDRPVGRLYVDRGASEIRIVDIALLPHVRGAGIGTRLLERLQVEAASSGRVLSLHVEVHNPAARLYERLGFLTVAERGVHRRMEWSR